MAGAGGGGGRRARGGDPRRRTSGRAVRRGEVRAGQRGARSREPRHVPLLHRLHGHGGHHPHRRHGRALEVRLFHRLRAVHVHVPLPALRELGLGRRMARDAGGERRARTRPRGLRRIHGGPHDGWGDRARRHARARAARRQVPPGRHRPRHARSQPSHDRGRYPHSRFRLVRVQRRLDALRVRSANRDHRRQQHARVRYRRARCAVLCLVFAAQAGHRDGLQRASRRPRFHHRLLRLRGAGGGRADRHGGWTAHRFLRRVARAPVPVGRSRGRDLRARPLRRLGSDRAWALRRWHLRFGLEWRRGARCAGSSSGTCRSSGRNA